MLFYSPARLIFKGGRRWHHFQHHLQENSYFIHKRQRIPPLHKRHVHQQAGEDKRTRVEVLPLRLVHDGRHHQVRGHNEYHVRDYYWHLIWSWCMWLGVPHDDQGQHGASIENPCGKREKVDQRVDCAVQHHRYCYQRVKYQSRGRRKTSHVNIRQNIQQVSFTRCSET